MDDQTILKHIQDLVDEEHQLMGLLATSGVHSLLPPQRETKRESSGELESDRECY